MFASLINKLKNSKFTLRFSVITILIIFFIVLISVLTPLFYQRLEADVLEVSFQLLRASADEVVFRVKDEISDIEITSDFTRALIQQGILNPHSQEQFLQYLATLMRVQAASIKSVQSAFWGDETGNFIMAERHDDGSVSTELIDRTVSPPTRKFIYYDEKGRLIKTVYSTDLRYDPRIRPWYVGPKTAKKSIWTPVYAYRITNFLGTTYATPLYKSDSNLDGVMILNVRIDFLRRFIEHMRISEHSLVYIVQDDGQIIAYPHVEQVRQRSLMTVNQTNLPWLKQSFDHFTHTKIQEFSFKSGDTTYLAIYRPLQSADGHRWYIGVLAPESDFLRSVTEMDEMTIFIGFLILLLGIFVVFRLLNRLLNNPINELIHETEKIKKFDLGKTPPIQSRIREIFLLARAVDAMKQGLRSFQKYVPATLVRQLIETGEDVRVGGVRKNLAIFFSDIKDFTSISEHTDAGQLTRHICEYFEELSKIIVEDRGTIDKYIGDSIMAIWGAPLPEADPCYLAAKAAIECERRLSALNMKWKQQGRATLYTRIGLHTGEAIVGNVGSTERVSYTAIGDAINMTSRLEGINKMYGTQIMVSEAFHDMVKNKFILRKVDKVTLKGKEEFSFIYELIAENKEKISFDIDRYNSIFEKAFAAYQNLQWEEAISLFEECLTVYPEDKVAHVFIHRCKHFMEKPPGADWDGVWHISEK